VICDGWQQIKSPAEKFNGFQSSCGPVILVSGKMKNE